MHAQQQRPFVWIDCEMTGLDPQQDHILEVAVAITDTQLELIDDPIQIVIHQPGEILNRMNPWCLEQHMKSGLTDDVRRSSITLTEATKEVLAYISYWCKPHTAPLCGNTIYQDRLFLKQHMPTVEQYLHYRLIDVSTVKELFTTWYPMYHMNFKKEDRHRALSDILESIAELQFYKTQLHKHIHIERDAEE